MNATTHTQIETVDDLTCGDRVHICTTPGGYAEAEGTVVDIAEDGSGFTIRTPFNCGTDRAVTQTAPGAFKIRGDCFTKSVELIA